MYRQRNNFSQRKLNGSVSIANGVSNVARKILWRGGRRNKRDGGAASVPNISLSNGH